MSSDTEADDEATPTRCPDCCRAFDSAEALREHVANYHDVEEPVVED